MRTSRKHTVSDTVKYILYVNMEHRESKDSSCEEMWSNPNPSNEIENLS